MKRVGVLGSSIIVILLLTVLVNAAQGIMLPDTSSVLSDFAVTELLPNPYLEEEPNITILGDSGEFSYTYDSAQDTAELIWQHTGGTALNWASKGYGWPDCLDHIRLSQSVLWSENREPDGLLVTMEAKVQVTGDFATEEDGLRMFDCVVYAKTTESPSDWYPLMYFHTDADEFTLRVQEISIPTIRNAWENVLEDCFDQYGVVTSEFDIVIALSPTYRFEEWVDYEPWRHYNGQVKLTVNSLSIEVLMSEPAEPEQIREPISSNVISSNDGRFFSRGLTTTEDGSVYGLANLYPRSFYHIYS